MSNSFISFDLAKLASFYGVPVEELKDQTINQLDTKREEMRKKIAEDEASRNAEDKEYIRLLKKYFKPYDYLLQFWTEQEIVLAASRHMPIYKIIQEANVPIGVKAYWTNAEYLRTSVEYVPQYTKSGEQLMDTKRERRDVYQICNQYQGLCHGEIFLDLLYTKYPDLKKYDFSAYSCDNASMDMDKYEIYPKNLIYTPFTALMNGDIEAIKTRNLEYAKAYNSGEFTVKKVTDRLNSPEIREYFETICNLGKVMATEQIS